MTFPLGDPGWYVHKPDEHISVVHCERGCVKYGLNTEEQLGATSEETITVLISGVSKT